MRVTSKNYYSQEANQAYYSVSQIKSFMECPARTMAELRGEWHRPVTKALLVGSYVDSYFEGTLKKFKEEHPECYKRDGELKAEYLQADAMIMTAEADPLFMEYMKGRKQVIRTGKVFGFPFKIKMDVDHPKRIVDLKTVANFKPVYRPGKGRMNFVEAWGYTLQGAIYQSVEGHDKPFYINAITKEDIPDIATIHIEQPYLDAEMAVLQDKLPYFDAIKTGTIEPPRCEHCAYCKSTRRLTHVMTLDEFESIYFEEE